VKEKDMKKGDIKQFVIGMSKNPDKYKAEAEMRRGCHGGSFESRLARRERGFHQRNAE